jgi:hypothetical protein
MEILKKTQMCCGSHQGKTGNLTIERIQFVPKSDPMDELGGDRFSLPMLPIRLNYSKSHTRNP